MSLRQIHGWHAALLAALLTPCFELDAQQPVRLGHVDTQTRWAFRSLSPVTVSSSIVRLRDVAQPLDAQMAGWPRLSRSIVGLVPVDGAKMTIERSRLDHAIRNAEATPNLIDWIGPAKIEVSYRKGAGTSAVASMAAPANNSFAVTRQAAYQQPVSPPSSAPQASSQAVARDSAPELLSAAATASILSLIRLALDKQHPAVGEEFEVEINPRQAELAKLKSMRGIPHTVWVDAPSQATCRVRVTGKNFDGPCEAIVGITLRAHPTVVCAVSSLPRGHRIARRDLLTRPLPAAEIESTYLRDPAELIGLEVRRSIRADRPISHSDVGKPILIRRGDKVEIRVVQGAIAVTTDGRALEEGAEFDTIEVEKEGTRKRLLARVVHSGLVEIVTRAPRVGQ